MQARGGLPQGRILLYSRLSLPAVDRGRRSFLRRSWVVPKDPQSVGELYGPSAAQDVHKCCRGERTLHAQCELTAPACANSKEPLRRLRPETASLTAPRERRFGSRWKYATAGDFALRVGRWLTCVITSDSRML